MNNSFAGKTVVITGATSGIGEAAAIMFKNENAKVIGIGRNEEKGEYLKSLGIDFMPCDVSNAGRLEEVCLKILQDNSSIDVLVNSAGISVYGTVETMSLEDWRESFAVNVDATFLTCKYFIPRMKEQGGGRIINLGSTAGTVGAGGLQAYSSTKGAVIQLTKSLAAEYSSQNILVNALCPGGTRTPMMLKDGEESCNNFAQLFPIKRLGEPEEIASAILFLAGDGASFMTGSVMLVDGGFTCI